MNKIDLRYALGTLVALTFFNSIKYLAFSEMSRLLGLMEYVLCDKDDTDITIMTAFRKQITHACTGIRVIQQVQYKLTWLASKFFKINWRAFVLQYVQT